MKTNHRVEVCWKTNSLYVLELPLPVKAEVCFLPPLDLVSPLNFSFTT